MIKKLLLIVFTAVSFACVSASEAPKIMQGLESIQSVAINNGWVVVGVKSNGCTQPADFDLVYTDRDVGVEIMIKRTKADRCRRRSFITQVELELDGKILKERPLLFIINPLGTMLGGVK